MVQLNESTIAHMWRLTRELKSESSYLHVRLALIRLRDALIEEKYRPDQPRAPKGTPEAGQWIVDAGSARQQRLAGERVLVGQSGYSMGKLVAQYPLSDKIQCVYKFDFGLVAVPGSVLGCQRRVPSAAVQHGHRLNDN